MCVWCAYSGNKEAAPILWNSVHDIEGIWAGFYTGMVCECQGEFHWRKCVGHTGIWKDQFDFGELPGTCGMLHSRTDSGGDQRFAHPFVGCHRMVAAISQGSTGIFSNCTDRFIQAGNELLDKGWTFDGAEHNPGRQYKIHLKDGSRVPLSEIATSVVEDEYLRSHDIIASLRAEASRLPEESATIFLFADKPGIIGFINVNQRIVWQRRPGEVFASVTTLGLPDGFGTEIPGNTIGTISPDGIHVESIDDALFPIDNRIPKGALTAFRNYVKEHPGALLGHVVDGALAPLFPHQSLEYRAVTGYRILETLVQNNEITMSEAFTAGSTGVEGRVFKLF